MTNDFRMSYFMPPIAPIKNELGRIVTPATLIPSCEVSVECSHGLRHGKGIASWLRSWLKSWLMRWLIGAFFINPAKETIAKVLFYYVIQLSM